MIKNSGTLLWERIEDDDYNGRPVYEYKTAIGNVKFDIVWACDAGFGLSVYDHDTKQRLNKSHGIISVGAEP